MHSRVQMFSLNHFDFWQKILNWQLQIDFSQICKKRKKKKKEKKSVKLPQQIFTETG